MFEYGKKVCELFEKTNDRVSYIGQLKESKTDVLQHQYIGKQNKKTEKTMYEYVYVYKKLKKW